MSRRRFRAAFVRAAMLAALMVGLTGCASNNVGFHVGEAAFHALNAVDQAQSVNAISHDCYVERDPLTRGLLGPKPEAKEFALYGLGISLAFHAFNRLEWVQDRPRLRAVVDILAIGAKGYAVARNHSIGMRISGDNAACVR